MASEPVGVGTLYVGDVAPTAHGEIQVNPAAKTLSVVIDAAGTLTTLADGAAAVTAHEAAGDPHVGYQKESEKGVANGYASLGAGGLVPVAQLGSGTPNGTKFVRDDGTLAAPVATSLGVGTLTDTLLVKRSGAALASLAQDAGWVDPTGTSDKTTFATSTVTLENLAEFVKAMYEAGKTAKIWGAA